MQQGVGAWQVTRNESVLAVRQCTAVNPHVLLLVAASLRVAGEPDDEDDSNSGSEDDYGGPNGLPAGPTWCVPLAGNLQQYFRLFYRSHVHKRLNGFLVGFCLLSA